MNNIEWRIEKKAVDFHKSLDFMEKRVEEIILKKSSSLIWILEHPPVYTAGVSAKDSDLLSSSPNIPIVKTNRGGKYTYHGEGMKIIYVMLDLKEFFAPKNPDIANFVKFLEEWVIEFLAAFNLTGQIRKDRVGVWVYDHKEEKKIAAMGIKVKKWVSYHGIAINIEPDLLAFKNIVPCGIKEFGVTSFKDLGVKIDKDLDEVLQKSFFVVKERMGIGF